MSLTEARLYWIEQVKIMREHIVETVCKCRRRGTICMSAQNFKQLVPTESITVPVEDFDRLFDAALSSVPNVQTIQAFVNFPKE